MPTFPAAAGSTKIQPALCSLAPGDSAYLFGVAPAGIGAAYALDDGNVTAETILAGVASASVALTIKGPGTPPMICLEVGFSAAPGVFELDIQESDTNRDDKFILPTNAAYTVSAVNAATQNARVDLSPTGGKFLRVYMKTLTNAVNTYVKITRLA